MIKMYIFKLYNNDQLIELIDAAPDKSIYKKDLFKGWKYFNLSANANFLIAFDNTISIDNIVGVIKFGLYFKGTIDEHYGFNYIDVRKDHRHEGIGKRLLKEFNTLLHDNIPVWCSFFSDYCIETKFNEIIEKSLCNYDVVYDHKYVIKAGTAEHVYFY